MSTIYHAVMMGHNSCAFLLAIMKFQKEFKGLNLSRYVHLHNVQNIYNNKQGQLKNRLKTREPYKDLTQSNLHRGMFICIT